MSYQSAPATDITSDDKLWAALAYVLTPWWPIIILLIADKKSRPFIRAHNAQALALGVCIIVLDFLCIGVLLWLVGLYWAYQAYQGKYVNIPVITDFCKKQGWA